MGLRTVSVTVLGGLPVTVDVDLDADDPSTGFRGGIADYTITHVGDNALKNAMWIYKRLENKKGAIDEFEEAIYEALDKQDRLAW